MSSNHIVVIGSCMIDFVSYCPRIPKPGETLHGSKFITTFGGKGANQCVAASKLGGQTSMIARVGDDDWGTKYLENFETENVDVSFVKVTANTSTGIAQINVADSGENQIVIVAGANKSLNVEDVEEAQNVIRTAAVVVTQLETSVDVALRAIQLCSGISILNGAPGLSIYDPLLLKLPTLFCVNETEASLFTGLPVNDEKEAEVAALNLLTKGCNNVLITLGPRGALYVSSEDKKVIHISTPQVNCVDSTGAGDAFIGALAFILANKRELSIQKAIEVACYVAANTVTKPGTQISFPGPEILQAVCGCN